MKFMVIYEQVVKNQAAFEIEALNEDSLLEALEVAENEMRARWGDTFSELKRAMEEQPELKVLHMREGYDDSWETPEYYDHSALGWNYGKNKN